MFHRGREVATKWHIYKYISGTSVRFFSALLFCPIIERPKCLLHFIVWCLLGGGTWLPSTSAPFSFLLYSISLLFFFLLISLSPTPAPFTFPSAPSSQHQPVPISQEATSLFSNPLLKYIPPHSNVGRQSDQC